MVKDGVGRVTKIMLAQSARMLMVSMCATACSFSITLAQPPAAPSQSQMCERYLVQASKQENVPLEVLYAVGLTESGNRGKMHPFALNIEGETVFARSKKQALKTFADARKQGKKLIDLGCMQVNHHYHGANFAGPEEMLVPEKNVNYAAKFLRELRREHGSWTMAVARYHASAGNKKAQKRYICNVIANLVRTDLGRWTPEARKFCGQK